MLDRGGARGGAGAQRAGQLRGELPVAVDEERRRRRGVEERGDFGLGQGALRCGKETRGEGDGAGWWLGDRGEEGVGLVGGARDGVGFAVLARGEAAGGRVWGGVRAVADEDGGGVAGLEGGGGAVGFFGVECVVEADGDVRLEEEAWVWCWCVDAHAGGASEEAIRRGVWVERAAAGERVVWRLLWRAVGRVRHA